VLYKLNHAATVGRCWIVLREVLARGDTRRDVPAAILAAQYHCRVRLSHKAFDSVPPYAQWLDLHLEHLQNCIEFDDQADLLSGVGWRGFAHRKERGSCPRAR